MSESNQSVSLDVKLDICKKSNILNMEICLEMMEELHNIMTNINDVSSRISEMYLRLRSDSMLIRDGFFNKKNPDVKTQETSCKVQETPVVSELAYPERSGYVKYIYCDSLKKTKH